MRIWKEAKEILTGIGLKVNEKKTQFRHARDGFDYLGFHFVRGYSQRKKKEVTYIIPTHKSRRRVWEKIRWYTDKRRYQNLPMEWIVENLTPFYWVGFSINSTPIAPRYSGCYSPTPMIEFGRQFATDARKKGLVDIGICQTRFFTSAMD